MKGTKFKDVEEIQQNVIRQLLTRSEDDFTRYFEKWKQYWTGCVALEGDYFAGN